MGTAMPLSPLTISFAYNYESHDQYSPSQNNQVSAVPNRLIGLNRLLLLDKMCYGLSFVFVSHSGGICRNDNQPLALSRCHIAQTFPQRPTLRRR